VTPIDYTHCYPQSAESLRAECVKGGREDPARLRIERPFQSARILVSRAQPQQILRCTLYDQTTLGVVLDLCLPKI
jgi:hypothetical protein